MTCGKKATYRLRLIAAALISLLFLTVQPAAAAAQDCARLGGGGKVGDAVIVLGQHIDAGDYTAADGVHLTGLPAFCRIFAVASPSPSSHVLIELWMPDAEKWNGKFLGVGNAGNAGKIGSSILAGGLKRGYATASTDMGSAPAAVDGVAFNFGNGRPEQIRDFGYRSTHDMTVLAKDVIARFYGKAVTRSYFVGCSTGGSQAMSEAQKFPDDYDGIIAGAPAHDRTHMHIHFSALRDLGTQPGAAIPMPLMAAWTHAIINACAGRDGGAPSDKFLTNPLQCTLSPRQLSCARTKDKTQCLSDKQVSALEQIYAGIRNPRTGQLIYYPDIRGAEELIFPIYDASLLPSSAFDIRQWILPPERAASSFDYDRDMKALDDAYAKDLNAMDTDLSRFAGHGGKLIMYHGWADGIISPLGSVDYYQRLTAHGMRRADFSRLFMVPGMGHCATGPGATDFGQLLPGPRAGASASNDILNALEQWVEEDHAPDQLIAGKTAAAYSFPPFALKGPTPETRPICAFPSLPRYDGKGDPLQATSFSCVPVKAGEFVRPAPEYLR